MFDTSIVLQKDSRILRRGCNSRRLDFLSRQLVDLTGLAWRNLCSRCREVLADRVARHDQGSPFGRGPSATQRGWDVRARVGCSDQRAKRVARLRPCRTRPKEAVRRRSPGADAPLAINLRLAEADCWADATLYQRRTQTPRAMPWKRKAMSRKPGAVLPKVRPDTPKIFRNCWKRGSLTRSAKPQKNMQRIL